MTYYDDKNRVTHSVQVNMDDVEYADLFDTSGNLKSYEDIDDTILATSPVTAYHYFTSSTEPGYSPDQPSYIVGPDGQVQLFSYDENNQQVSSWTAWEDPTDGDTAIDRYIYSTSVYDDAGRVVQTLQTIDDATLGEPYISQRLLSQTVYNSIGKVDYSISEPNTLTQYDYDETGNTVCTRTYNIHGIAWDNVMAIRNYIANSGNILTESRTLYDKEGRAVVSVGPYDPADTAHSPTGTETVYDALGRVERTRKWANVAIILQDIVVNDVVVGREATGWTTNGAAAIPGQELSYTRTIYDVAGRVEHSIVTDENHYERVTSYLYDIAGRQITTIDHLGHDITYTAQTIGGVVWNVATSISLKADESHRTDTYYDGSRRDYVEDAAGNITSFMYDAAGRLIRTTYPVSIIDGAGANPVPTYSHVGYDGLGRKSWESAQTCQIDPGHIDLTTESNNEKLRRKYFGYDAGGKLTSVTLPVVQDPDNGNTWTAPVYQYIYDDYGNQIAISDPNHQLTVFKFDCLNRQTRKYQPFEYNGQLTSSAIYTAIANQTGLKYEEATYNDFGRVETQTDYKGQLTVYTYDIFGRIEFERHYNNTAAYIPATPMYNANPEIAYTYDNLGHKLTESQTTYDNTGDIVGTAQEWEYDYDNEGRIIKVDSPNGVIDYTYSPMTGRIVLVAKDGTDLVTRYAYDELGRLSEVEIMLRNGAAPNPAEITYYGYDEVGNLDWVQLPNGNYTDYTYNTLNRLTAQVNYQNGLGSTVLSSYTYKVYADGQRSESTQTQGIDSITYQWKYDSLNRLTEEKLVGAFTYQRVYDLVSNVKTYTATEDGESPVVTTYLYNAMNQLLTETRPSSTITYGYDDNGSLISKQSGSDTETYAYDLLGKLKTFTPAAGFPTTYKYDPAGNRVGKSTGGVDTDYVVDVMNPTGYSQVLAETTGFDRTYYTIGLDVIGQSINAASPQYFIYDGHGSVRQLTQANSALVQSQDFWYDAYGNELAGNTPQTNLLYCGEQHDNESGLYYLRARMYNPQNGRFNSIDPFEGNNTDPISLHKYLYCHGNPINGIDPSGQMTLAEKLVVLGFLMNIANLSFDISKVIYYGIEDNKEECAKAWAWVIYDTMAIYLPYSGAGGAAARGGGTVIVNVMKLSKAGVEASAIMSYIRMMAGVADTVEEVGGSSGGGSSSSGPAGGKFKEVEGPGSWYEMKYWNANAAKYQSLRNGKPLGWDFYYNKVKFDGFRDGALLECKYNWIKLVSKKTGKFYRFMEYLVLKQAERQLGASNGMKVIWEWSDKEAADACKNLFQSKNIPFEVRYAPAL